LLIECGAVLFKLVQQSDCQAGEEQHGHKPNRPVARG
jgi:hypothetical protein